MKDNPKGLFPCGVPPVLVAFRGSRGLLPEVRPSRHGLRGAEAGARRRGGGAEGAGQGAAWGGGAVGRWGDRRRSGR